MRIGFSLPRYGGTADQPASIIQFARDIEHRGAGSLWVDDRALVPVTPTIGFGRGYATRWRSSSDLDNAESGRTVLDMRTQVGILMDVGYIAHQCRAAVELLLDINGAGGFANANPLQRVWRDIEVASRHGIINPLIAQEVFGKILVGAEKTIIWGE